MANSSAMTDLSSVPSIDEQVNQLLELQEKPLEENQKGYILSTKWLFRLLARSSHKSIVADKNISKKDTLEGELGPVDNGDLLPPSIDSSLKDLKDEFGEPFVPLREGLTYGEDFDVLTSEAWEYLLKWHQVKNESPTIIRYVHDTTINSDVGENFQYELYPPTFTILKLSHFHDSPEDSKVTPITMLASRNTPYQTWLKTAKEKAAIPMENKVRVWRVLDE